jgi:hypothetical protein
VSEWVNDDPDYRIIARPMMLIIKSQKDIHIYY